MKKSFYSSPQYQELQRSISKKNWLLGKFNHLKKHIIKKCRRVACGKAFTVIPSNTKEYCSSHCFALINNIGRRLSMKTKTKIARALSGRPNPRKGEIIIPRLQGICARIDCKKQFFYERWKNRKFCSSICAIKTVGTRPTSPKAARAKAGIRSDLGSYYFYSRWEANYARLLNLLGIKWVFQPKSFRLKNQNYTPDFYLPAENVFVEIKNFLSNYSAQRDKEFRELYPNLKLKLILKEDYLKLQEKFASRIKTWEYS